MSSRNTPTDLDTPFGPLDHFPIHALDGYYPISRLPVALKILLENLLRQLHNDTVDQTEAEVQIGALAGWQVFPDTLVGTDSHTT